MTEKIGGNAYEESWNCCSFKLLLDCVGQIYNGQILKGLILIGVQILNGLLMFLLIGFITYPLFWIWGMYDAYKTAERINRETANF